MSSESAPHSRVVKAKVVKAYTPKTPQELSLLVGDELIVFDSSNKNMWFGKIITKTAQSTTPEHLTDSLTGWFPAINCVVIESDFAPKLPTHPSNQSSKGGVRLSIRIDNSMFRNQLTAQIGDPGIIVGTSIPGVPDPKDRKHARVIYDYQETSTSELTLKAGEIVSLLTDVPTDSWWECQNTEGLVGYFPSDFLQVFRDPQNTKENVQTIVEETTEHTDVLDCPEFDDPHAVAIIAQAITSHEPTISHNDSGLPFLTLKVGDVIALLDSNPNHPYWLAVHYNNNNAELFLPPESTPLPVPSSKGMSKRIGLVPKHYLFVLEGLAEPHANYPYEPKKLGPTCVLVNRALGSVQTTGGKPAHLARVGFEFTGENENEHEFLASGDLVWVIDDNDQLKNEAWIESECDTKRGFCPASFLEILSDEVLISVTSSSESAENDQNGSAPVDSSSPKQLSKLDVPLNTEVAQKSVPEIISQESDQPSSPRTEDLLFGIDPAQFEAGTIARALYSYQAEADSELTIEAGNLVRLVDYPPNEEWWEGILLADDGSSLPETFIGFFPRDFVVILQPPKKSKKRPKRGASKKKKKEDEVTSSKKDKRTKTRNTELAGQLAAKAEAFDSQVINLAHRDAEISTLSLQVQDLQSELESKQNEITQLNSRISSQDEEISQLKLLLSEAKNAADKQLTLISSLQATTASLEAQAQNASKSAHQELKSANTALKQSNDELSREVIQLKQQIESLKSTPVRQNSVPPQHTPSIPKSTPTTQPPVASPSVSKPTQPPVASPSPPKSTPTTLPKQPQAIPKDGVKVQAVTLVASPLKRSLPPLPPTPNTSTSSPSPITTTPSKTSNTATIDNNSTGPRLVPPKQPAPSLPNNYGKQPPAPAKKGGRVQGFLAGGAKKSTTPDAVSSTQPIGDGFSSKRQFFEKLNSPK